jgi:hypothetical protein
MSSARRGVLLLEIVVTLALVVALIALAAPGIRRLRDLQVNNVNRAEALRGCSAALAVLDSMPWGDVTPASAEDSAVMEVMQANLPEGELKLDVESGSTDAKRLTAIVQWSGPEGTTRSVRLTAWRYRTAEQMP